MMIIIQKEGKKAFNIAKLKIKLCAHITLLFFCTNESIDVVLLLIIVSLPEISVT